MGLNAVLVLFRFGFDELVLLTWVFGVWVFRFGGILAFGMCGGLSFGLLGSGILGLVWGVRFLC